MTPAIPPLPLKLYLLGSFHLENETGPLLFTSGKVQLLLAYLALHPGKHTREKLAGVFWGESPETRARNSLRTILKKLGKQLDRRLLLVDRTTVQINPEFPLRVDAREFLISDPSLLSGQRFRLPIENADQSEIKNLKSKIDLYRGDLLEDFYDDWIVPEREHMRELFLAALLHLTETARSAGEYKQAMSYAQRVLTADPANERAHQHLMFCNLALGDRSAALKQYAVCVHALQTELAVEPARETTALYHWIQQATPERVAVSSRSLAAQITNLPIPVSSFIGRKKELTRLKQRLMTTRLLTLSGAGGSGKTRLAIQLGTELIDSFHDGVWWVDLAAWTGQVSVLQAVAQVFGIRADTPPSTGEHGQQELFAKEAAVPAGSLPVRHDAGMDAAEPPGESLTTALVHFLREKQLLLVLDNCEHLIAACARLADLVLTHCPNVQFLTTSREALRVTGERVYQVPTLSLPPRTRVPLADSLMEYESIRLFVERAGAVRADFELNAQNAAAVVELCRQLDGIPLALELAAARIKSLSAGQITERLHDRFALLTHGSRTALPRHQTLRETMDWSHNLLSGSERILFRRVSVFAGGFTLDAVQVVCSGAGIPPSQVLGVLSQLVDKSLVHVDEVGQETRYHLLETIRQYAREQLDASGETARLLRRHRDFFIALAEKAEPKLKSPEQFEWADRLEVEHDNLRAAWSSAIASNAGFALRLASALLDFWLMRGNPGEGREWLTKLLTRTRRWGQTALRAQAFNVAGRLAHYQYDLSAARLLLEQGLQIARACNDKKEMAFALVWLGKTVVYLDEPQNAQAFMEEGLTLYQELRDEWGIAVAFHRLSEISAERGYGPEAQKEFFLESLARYRKLGDKFREAEVLIVLGENARFRDDYEHAGTFYLQALEILGGLGRFRPATPLFNLAWVSLRLGDHRRANELFQESLRLHQEYGYKRGKVEECLGGLAAVLGMTGKPEPAALLFGAVDALFESIGTGGYLEPLDRREYDHYVAAVRAQLDESTFLQRRAEGRTLTLEQALDYAFEKSGANM